MKKCLCLAVFFSVLFVSVSTNVFANGFQIYQAGSAEAKGLAAAVVGRDDLISNAWYNPAALTDFQGDKAIEGISMVNLTQTYNPGAGMKSMSLKSSTYYLPNSHWVHRASKDVVFALSSSIPFGLGVKWKDADIRRLMDSGRYNNSPAPAGGSLPAGTTTSLGLAQKAELRIPYMNASLATKFSRKFSMAAGLSLIRADLKLRFLNRATLGPATLWDKFVLYQADGIGFGWLVAGHYKLDDSWKVGFRYMSRAHIDMTGSVEDHPAVGNVGVRGDLNLPSRFTLGVSNELFEGLTLSFDVLWTEWSQYKELRIDNANSWALPGGFVAKKDWQDTLSYHFGAEYDYSEKWVFRFGYSFENSPIPNTTRNLELPDSDGQLYAIGVGRKGPKWNWDIAYSYMSQTSKRTMAGTEALNGQGTFSNGTNQFLSLSVSKLF